MNNFERMNRKYGINDDGWSDEGALEHDLGHAPCFCERADAPVREMVAEDIPKYLRACQKQTIGVVILSVTSKEEGHERWIAEAKKINGATVTKGRSTAHGGYPVWLICLPGTAKN